MLTISQVGKRFQLSRSTLLYYDAIGLLTPSQRSRAGYRLYDDDALKKMELIAVYRKMGLSLTDIAAVVADRHAGLSVVLEDRLRVLDSEIRKLRRQQKMILQLLQSGASEAARTGLDKHGWVAILEASGWSDEDMQRWHREFERLAPQDHQEFLESLGIDAEEISQLRTSLRSEIQGETS